MAFPEELKLCVDNYCSRDLPENEWYGTEFNFVRDDVLRNRLVTEFKNARYVYKIFEGLGAKDELLLAEVRLQVLMYASIFEAVIHYVLFEEYYKNDQHVKDSLIQIVTKPYSLPQEKLEKLKKELKHDGKEFTPYFKTTQRRDITKVRFDEKCRIAEKIGLIQPFKLRDKETVFDILIDKTTGIEMVDFASELIRIYEVRNAIHLQAELKKDVEYHLGLSCLAYKRMRPFIDQIKKKLYADGMI